MISDGCRLACFICLASFCIGIEGSLPLPSSQSSPFTANGQLYSEWSEWSTCSATCGIGIIMRTRTCLKSAYNSRGVYVPLCHAEYAEHKICNLQNCPPNAPGTREIQCSQHNNKTVAGKFVKLWIPTTTGPNPCELRCEAKSEGLEYGFGKVSSGTPCPQGVCLDGRCLRVGCDDRLGSDVVLDMCGVCGGRNASCVHYKDVYMGQPPADSERRNGYHEVVVLPVGARNLIIRQLVGKNYLALQDRSRGIIFNGQQHLTKYGGHFDIAGTTVQFQKSDNVTEILTSEGPVTEELYILVLLRTFNQGIYYEYWLPKQSYNPSRSRYSVRRPDNSHSVITSTTTTKPTQPSSHPRRRIPTKPAYAYGYGEKPYRSQDAPVFRRFATSTTSTPQQPLHYGKNLYSRNSRMKDTNPLYKPRSYRPPGGYYQTFRNAKSLPDFEKELPALTQPDSYSKEHYDNIIPNIVLDHELSSPKSAAIGISKRADKSRNYVTNGRLKYSVASKSSDQTYANVSERYAPASLSIALLPLPSRDRTKSKKDRQKGGLCEPCERRRDQIKHFCESDFVIRGLIVGYEFLQGETRYELEVKQTFKNTLSLLPKEYIWSPDTCRCPRLRPGKEYVIMGRIDNSYRKRESRLLVDKKCFVRTFSLKYARRLQKLKKDHTKKCTKES